MKELFAKYAKNFKVLGIIFLGNLLLMLYCILFLNPVSSSNDDFFLGIIAGNGFGSNSSFLIYTSTFYGYFLKVWYTLFPNVNWYILFSYFFLLISVSIVEYILVIKYKTSGVLLSIFFSVGFSHYFYVVFQYTKVASLLTLAGFFILLYWLDEVHDSAAKRNLKYLLSTLFLFAGSLIRLQPFFMVCVFGFGLWVLKFLQAFKEKECKKFFRYFVYPLVPIFGFVLGFSFFEEKIWDASTEELCYFQEYNQVRTQLVDYEIPDYQTHLEEYQALQLSGNDIENLKRWCFADSDKFPLEVLKEIASMNHNNHFSLREFLKYICDNIMTHTIWKLCVILTLCCLLLTKRKNYGQLLYPHLAFFFVLFYLHYIGRITEWVINSLWITYLLAVIAVVCAHFSKHIYAKKNLLKAAVCCLLGTVVFNSEILLIRAVSSQPMHTELYQCMNSISSTKELNFFCDVTSVYDMSRDYRIFDKTPEDFFSNIFFSGAWFSCSPQENYAKKQAGIKNIYRDILYLEDYVVLDKEAILQKQLYLTENYSSTARYSKIQDFYGYPIYKFSDNYTGERTESASSAVLQLTPSVNGYHQISGILDCTPEELHGATVYLEITDSDTQVTTTYAGRFEQTNTYGLYSLRYNKALAETNQITFEIPEYTALSSQYQYKLLLRYKDRAQVLSVKWE